MDSTYIICHMMRSIHRLIGCDMVDKISWDEYYELRKIYA